MKKIDFAKLLVSMVKHFEQNHIDSESIESIEINDDRGGTGTFEVIIKTTIGYKHKEFKENIP